MKELTADEKAYIANLCKEAKRASAILRSVGTAQKNKALEIMAKLLEENRSKIKQENAVDLENAEAAGISGALLERLQLSDKVIDSIITSLHDIRNLKDPVGEVIAGWKLENGIELNKIRVPIGVLAVIYESRPNVTVDVGALALKSSNAAILRGGKEAIVSNQLLASLFQKALAEAGLPSNAIQLMNKTSRHLVPELLKQDAYIDLVVPRGGEGLIRFVTENSLIPVVKHDKGVCHVYIHETADPDQATKILINAKTQRPSVCNAAECVVLDKDYPEVAQILKTLQEAGVTLRGDSKTQAELQKLNIPCENLTEEGYHKEYLDLEISVKLVENLEQAILHISEYSSGHSEAIVTRDLEAAHEFTSRLDSAALFVNCSTRFHDGGQFGLGAEVGISTGKLHARGPMSIADLTTSKYILRGQGQIRE
ncbi:MAG: glutamate-5-semialdehyde dehydrogenase [Candidatus Hydrogenedentota bacterium]|nr:MAG: glutamate-5-semialdehyde dehydrogenase [Candidatus Hydrogenedentota bacterium]